MRRLVESVQKGAMIALKIPSGVAEKLAALGTKLAKPQSVDEMHCTLVFFPDVAALGPEGTARAEQITAKVARQHLPIQANIVGAGMFRTLNEESGGYPYVALLNAPSLNLLQADLVRALVAEGFPVSQQYGYIPHVTLGYDPGDAPVPLASELPKDEWPVAEIYAYWEWGNGHPIRMVEGAPKGGRIVANEDDEERGAHRMRNLRGINEELYVLRSGLSEESEKLDVFIDPETLEAEFSSALALVVAKLIEGGQIDAEIVDDPSKLGGLVQKVLNAVRQHRGLINAAMRRLKRFGTSRTVVMARRDLARI